MTEEEIQEQKNLQHSVMDENIIQKNLNIAKNSFCDDKIKYTSVLTCTYNKPNITYNNEEYHIVTNENEKGYYSSDTEVYIPVFVLDYNGLNQVFTNGWYG